MQLTSPSSDYIFPTILPWPTIFDDLSKAGLPYSRLALMFGKAPTTLHGWVTGQFEPKDSYARAIIQIHTLYCGEEQTQVRISQATYID